MNSFVKQQNNAFMICNKILSMRTNLDVKFYCAIVFVQFETVIFIIIPLYGKCDIKSDWKWNF